MVHFSSSQWRSVKISEDRHLFSHTCPLIENPTFDVKDGLEHRTWKRSQWIFTKEKTSALQVHPIRKTLDVTMLFHHFVSGAGLQNCHFFSTLSTLPTPPAAFMWGQRRLGNCLPHLPESRCSEIGFQSLIFLCKAVKPCCAIYMKLHILILHISCSKTDQLEVSLSTLWA